MLHDLLFLLEHFEDIHTIVRWTRDKDAAKMRLMEELGMREEAAASVIDAGIDDFTYENLDLVRADLVRAQRIIRFFMEETTMNKREQLAEVFRDTQVFYRDDPILAEAVARSCKGTKLYTMKDYPAIPSRPERVGAIRVSKKRSFQAAMDLHQLYPEKRIAVLNFASAYAPGGGVIHGSAAQEESLCRCSTLYPALAQRWLRLNYYEPNRLASDTLDLDSCIYTPGVVICKTDEDLPKRLPPEQFVTVDVISCTAPDLRKYRQNRTHEEYVNNLRRRANHILHTAAVNGVEIVVLGAFGCGVYANKPADVRNAFEAALQEYHDYFDLIEFAVYCGEKETENYREFHYLNDLHVAFDEVKILRAGRKDRELFGEAYGAQAMKLTAEQLNALLGGGQLAIPVMSGEYVLFLEGPAADS